MNKKTVANSAALSTVAAVIGVCCAIIKPCDRLADNDIVTVKHSGPALGGARLAAPVKEKWVYTVTTNDQGQVTSYATKGTNVVMTLWNDFVVPMRYRTKFFYMSDEDRNMITGATAPELWTEKDPVEPYVNPKQVEAKVTDDNTTEEVREIEVRGW